MLRFKFSDYYLLIFDSIRSNNQIKYRFSKENSFIIITARLIFKRLERSYKKIT